MSRRSRSALVAPLVAACVLGGPALLAGCSGDADRTPTVASVDFDTELRLAVPDDGPLELDRDRTATTEVPAGSVLVVTNTGEHDHRLVATSGDTQIFDTGTLRPGDDTTVVVASDRQLTVRDTMTDRELTVTVTPRP